MTSNYKTPTISPDWADSRQTDRAVAVAIHAISDSTRSPEAIWEAPTSAEWDHVIMAVQEYVRLGYFGPQDRFSWGQETFTIPPDNE